MNKLTIMLFLIGIFFLSTPILAQEGGDMTHFQLGTKYMKEKKYENAIDEFRKFLNMNPTNNKAYSFIAQIRMTQKKFGLAAYNFKKALYYKKDDKVAAEGLGEAYQKNGNLEKAIIQYRKFINGSKDKKKNEILEKRIDEIVDMINNPNRAKELAAAKAKKEAEEKAARESMENQLLKSEGVGSSMRKDPKKDKKAETDG